MTDPTFALIAIFLAVALLALIPLGIALVIGAADDDELELATVDRTESEDPLR